MKRNEEFKDYMTDEEIMSIYTEDKREGINKMVEKYSRYIYHVINKYFPSFYREMEEMYNHGVIGIISAMKHYDATRGCFSTFATPFIKKEINKHTRFLNGDNSEYFAHIQNSVKKAQNKIEANGEQASVEKIMEETGLSSKIVAREMKIDRVTVSYDVLESYTYDMDLSDNFIINDLLSGLPKESRQIVYLRAIEGKSFSSIAKMMSKSMFCIKQDYESSIKSLRRSLE